MNDSLALPIHEPSQAGEARRLVAAWSRGHGWGEEMAGRVAIVITELGLNLALHTKGGTLLLRSLSQGSASGVEILSLDAGPGVANFNECLRDGYSTAGTSGTGLGAVRRASHVFATHSQPGIGTVLLSEVWAKPPDFRAGGQWLCGAINVAMPGELICGDCWAEQHSRPDVIRVMMQMASDMGSSRRKPRPERWKFLKSFPLSNCQRFWSKCTTGCAARAVRP